MLAAVEEAEVEEAGLNPLNQVSWLKMLWNLTQEKIDELNSLNPLNRVSWLKMKEYLN